MRRLLLVVAALPALALASAGAPGGVVTVGVSSRGFDPAALTVHAGDTVTWTNTGTLVHQVSFDGGALGPSPVLQPGQSWSLTMKTQGRFNYRDALHESLKATVVVTSPAPSVTIGSARTAMVYGGTGLMLTGRVSSHRAGEAVQVVARICGAGSAPNDVVTGAGGIWRLVVRPPMSTVFGATWQHVPSSALAISVAPRIRLSRTRTALVVEVTAAMSLAHRIVALQSWNAAGRSWTNVVSARLKAAGRSSSGTAFSTATLRKRAGRLRILLTASQAAPCYGQSASNAVGP